MIGTHNDEAVRAARRPSSEAGAALRAALIASGAINPSGTSELTPVPETGTPVLRIGRILPSEGPRLAREAGEQRVRSLEQQEEEERARVRREREEVERERHRADDL